MASTFNEILRSDGVDPREVSLLRHQTNKGAPGRTPYTLWRDDLAAFELYQSTQKRRPVFRNAKYWAAFVAPEKYETLFVGLYEVSLDTTRQIDWIDPLTDRPVGDGRPGPYDVFEYALSTKLRSYIGRLRIDWDARAIRSWVQYAAGKDAGKDKVVIELPVVTQSVTAGSEEGKQYWVTQRKLERDARLRREAIHLNVARYGQPTCEACEFSNSDIALFDVHHPNPLRLGIRMTKAEELEVLCPICHRHAHRADALRPKSIIELRNWIASGRP